MIGIMGKSILLGIDGAVPYLTNVLPIQEVELRNADFSYLNVAKNLYNDLPTSIPLDWVRTTIMNSSFNTLNAGNLDFLSDAISRILVQRSRIDEGDGSWITLLDIPVINQEQLNFTVSDFTNASNATYIYRIVPIFINDGVEYEGTGSESEEIDSMFDGIFICDSSDFVNLYADAKYSDLQTVQVTGVHQTLGNRYPIIVTNSKTNYHTGGVSGTVVNKDFGKIDTETGTSIQLNEKDIIKRRKEIEAFITNKKPKIIKDYSGNIWLVIFTDNVSYSFFNDWGKSLGTISMNWTEIGNAENETDLRRTGFTGGGLNSNGNTSTVQYNYSSLSRRRY